MILHPNYDSPAALKLFLDEHSMAMQKKFGQNFLINAGARKKIIDKLDVFPGCKVWEVGPGLGAMTSEILDREADVTAFEIDKGFSSFLPQFFEDKKFTLVFGDVLKTWETQLKEEGLPNRFFGNLPYNVAATILATTIARGVRFDKAVVTVQKEVAMRMTAKCGSEDYSSFSVLCQWAYDVIPIMDLAGGSFWPRPNVDSRAVLMTKKEAFPCCDDPDHFMKLQRALFVSRRKTIKNNLTQFYSDSQKADRVLKKAEIDSSTRAEKMTIQQLLHLSDVSIQDGKN